MKKVTDRVAVWRVANLAAFGRATFPAALSLLFFVLPARGQSLELSCPSQTLPPNPSGLLTTLDFNSGRQRQHVCIDNNGNVLLMPEVMITPGTLPPPLSATGQGTIYFDSAAGVYKVSQNGGAYVTLVGGGGVSLNSSNTWTRTQTFAPTIDAIPALTKCVAAGVNDCFQTYGNSSVVVPSQATTSTAAGGSLAATSYFAQVTCVDDVGGETTVSAESAQQAVGANNLLVVSSPAASGGCAGWRPYVTLAGSTSGTETLQAVSGNCTLVSDTTVAACAIGSNWTEPTSSTVSSSAVPASNTARVEAFAVPAAGGISFAGNGSNFLATLTHSLGTNRTFSLPNTAGAIVVDGATQTLTGKTLTSPAFNTSIVLNPSSGVPALTLLWANPAANQNITFGDPGQAASVGYLSATPAQTFTGQTWSGGTFTGNIAGSPTFTGTPVFNNQVQAPSFKATSGPFTGVVQTLCAKFSTTDTLTANGAEQAFATTCNVPANTLGTSNTLRVTLGGLVTTSGAPPNVTFKVKLGGTVIFSSTAAAPSINASGLGYGAEFIIQGMAAPSGSSNVMTTPASSAAVNWFGGVNNTAQPVALATDGALSLTVSVTTSATDSGTKHTLAQLVVEQVN